MPGERDILEKRKDWGHPGPSWGGEGIPWGGGDGTVCSGEGSNIVQKGCHQRKGVGFHRRSEDILGRRESITENSEGIMVPGGKGHVKGCGTRGKRASGRECVLVQIDFTFRTRKSRSLKSINHININRTRKLLLPISLSLSR